MNKSDRRLVIDFDAEDELVAIGVSKAMARELIEEMPQRFVSNWWRVLRYQLDFLKKFYVSGYIEG